MLPQCKFIDSKCAKEFVEELPSDMAKPVKRVYALILFSICNMLQNASVCELA
jgi:hypothetical protein